MARPFLSIFAFACFLGATAHIAAVPAPKSEEEALFVRRIVEFYRDKETALVTSQVKQFLDEFPNSEYKDSFFVLLGDMDYTEKNYPAAYESYKQIEDPQLIQKVSSRELESLYRLKRWPELEKLSRQRMPTGNQGPKNLEQELVVFYLAESLYHQKNYIEAQPLYELLLFSPCKDNACLALADIYVSQGYPKKAVEIYLNLAKDCSQNLKERFLFQAAVLQKAYSPKASIDTFEQVFNLRGKLAPEAALNHAILIYEDGQYAKFVSKKDFYLKKVPREHAPLVQFMVGRSYFSMNQFKDAMTYLRPLLQKEDDTSINHKILLLTLIVSAHHLNQTDLMEEWAIAFENRYPGSPELAKVLYIKGLTYLKTKQYRDAELSFQRLILEFPSDEKIETVNFEKTASVFKQGRWADARTDFLEFIKQYPKSEQLADAYQYIARASLELLQEAKNRGENTALLQQQLLEDIQAALELPQKDEDASQPEHQLKMAQMLYDLQQYPQTIALLSAFMKAYPSDQRLYQAHVLMAACCRDGQKDLTAYAQHAEKALKLNPEKAEHLRLHRNLFSAYYQLAQQQPEKAAVHFALAAEHMYLAMMTEKEPVPREQQLWLANYYYQIVKNGQNEFNIEPLNDKDKIATAKKALAVYSKIIGEPPETLTKETLALEPEFIKVSNLHGWVSQPLEQIKILDNLEVLHKQNPDWPQTQRPYVQFGLATLQLANHEEEGLMDLLTQLIKSKTADPYITNASQLYFARLAYKKIPEGQKTLKNPDVVGILKIFKNLQIRKVLLEEPIHLEATLDYADLRSSLEPKEKQEEQLLFLLKRAKEDYTAQDDLYSKDYHAARSLHPDKDTVYQAYMMYLDARITELEGRQARKEGKVLEAERKSDTARILYKTVARSQFAVSKYLVNAAKSHLEEMNK